MATLPMDTVKITDLAKRGKKYTAGVSFKDIDLDRFYILSTKVVGPLRYTLFANKESTSAYLLMEGPAEKTSLEDIKAFAKSQKVMIHDDYIPSIKNLIASKFEVDGEHVALIISQGRDPKPGTDSITEWHVEEPFDNRGAASGDEQVDYRQRRNFVHVTKGQHILTVHPPTRGEPGLDFRGNEVPTSDGAWKRPLAGLGIVCEANQQNMYAECEGILQLMPDGHLNVRSMLEVHDVDFKTGNIHFEGDVDIGGFVREGFEVHSKGVVRVVNDIERAEVEGQEIAITGAILTSKVVAKGGPMMVGRVERSTLRADAEITGVADMVGATIHCGGTLTLEGKSFIGGEINALGGVRVGWLGGKGDSTTKVAIDPSTCELPACDESRAKSADLAEQIKKLEAALGPLIKNRAGLQAIPAAKRDPIEKLLARYDSLEFEVEVAQGSARRAASEATVEIEGIDGVVVTRGISEGVRIRIGELEWVNDQERAGEFTIKLSDDRKSVELHEGF